MAKRKYHKKRNKPLQTVIRVVVVLLVVTAMIFPAQPNPVADAITVEAGCDTVDPRAFLSAEDAESITLLTDLSSISLNVPGDYDVELSYKGQTYKRTLQVRDTVAPTGEIKNVSVYSTQMLSAADFVVSTQDVTNVTVSFKKAPDMTQEGSRSVTILLTDDGGNVTELQAILTVSVDNEGPILSGVTERQIYIGTEPDYLAGVTVADNVDPNPTVTIDDSQVDIQALGSYTVVYIAADAAGNETRQETTLTVTDDRTAPVITGAKDLTIYQGSTVSYRSGVRVSDDKDPNPTLSIDSGGVDLSRLGSYTVTYTAVDAAGNAATIKITVTVVEAPAVPDNQQAIYNMVDKLLAKLVTNDMTDREKVEAIYEHMRANYDYSGSSDKSDWMKGAYIMMADGQGDCFNYFALAKLMYERLGIPNIDVQKVKNYDGDSSHYWSLVSVDGGKTYYHVDCTPRVGDGDDFCLVTDAFLDAYSAAHENSHNRNKSLYPATPTE